MTRPDAQPERQAPAGIREAVAGLVDADLDSLVQVIRDAARGGCGSHEDCRALVRKHQRDAARRWLLDAFPATPSEPEAVVEEEWGVRVIAGGEAYIEARWGVAGAPERAAALTADLRPRGFYNGHPFERAHVVRRTRTTYADRVTEWEEVADQ